jgi:hypothetical protein
VSGSGVVCGLDVQPGGEDLSVIVKPGLALDQAGREIVVPCDSKNVPIEARPAPDPGKPGVPCEDEWVHLVICYRERRTDPEPVLAGGCDPDERCAPGAVREDYELVVRPGTAPEISVDCRIPHLIKGNNVNYRALAEWVSAPCDEPSECCVTLANIHRPVTGGRVEPADIDISVRPIVFGADVLWQLVLALTHDPSARRNGKN